MSSCGAWRPAHLQPLRANAAPEGRRPAASAGLARQRVDDGTESAGAVEKLSASDASLVEYYAGHACFTAIDGGQGAGLVGTEAIDAALDRALAPIHRERAIV